jgi:autotransporter-associated beta strand protein
VVGADNNIGTGPLALLAGSRLQLMQSFTFSHPVSVAGDATIGVLIGNTATMSGVITDGAQPGGIVKTANGSLILTANNTYTGGTTINFGTLQLGNGGTTGSILGNVLNNAVFAINRSDTYSFDGVISGTGAFRQNGDGRTILTATSTYTGATTVNAGTLSVNGSIASSSGVDVNNGATLGGTGALPTTRINAGGTLSPGNSIGTVTIGGNLTFVGAGNYLVEVAQATADRTNVTGTAALAGTLRIMATGPFPVPMRYTLLNAVGGVSGTFGTTDLAGFGVLVNPSVTYDVNNVFLNLNPDTISSVLTNASVNQRNVATALDAGFAAGTMPAPFGAMFGLSSGALSGALNQLSGEIATGAATASFQDMGQYLQLMLDPFLENRTGAASPVGGPALSFAQEADDDRLPETTSAYARLVTKAPPMNAAPDRRWTTWGAAFGATGTFDGNGSIGSHDLNVRSGGFAGGIDYRLSPDTVIGFSAAGSTLSYNLETGLGSGHGEVFKAGVYASTRVDNAYLSAAFAYGSYDLSTTRNVFLPGFGDRLTADFDANSFAGRIEAGWRFAMGAASGLTPYAAFQAQSFHLPRTSEVSSLGAATGFGLAYAAHSADEQRSELGLRFDSRYAMRDDSMLLLRGRLGWAHEFSGDTTALAAFQALPGTGFTVTGAGLARDALLVSVGPELRYANGWSLRLKFDGEFSDRSEVYAGTGTLRYAW